MSEDPKTRTGEVNGRLWGARARDWADVQEGQCRAVYEAAFDRLLKPGMDYLDAGCGAGMAAAMAAGRGAKVTGVDAAPALLAIARERTPGGDFREGDLEELPFADGAFDLVTGFNSFQYAAHPVRALAEAGRTLRPGGRILVMTWGEPEGMAAAGLVRAIGPLLPPPPPGAPGPFALSGETALREFAGKAGLEPLDVFDVPSPFDYADLDEALRGLDSSGVAMRAMALVGEEAVRAAHAEALAPHRRPDGRYVVDATFRCLVAKRG